MTKCFWAVGETPDVRHFMEREAIANSKDYVNQYGLSRLAIFNAVNASLKRLARPRARHRRRPKRSSSRWQAYQGPILSMPFCIGKLRKEMSQ